MVIHLPAFLIVVGSECYPVARENYRLWLILGFASFRNRISGFRNMLHLFLGSSLLLPSAIRFLCLSGLRVKNSRLKKESRHLGTTFLVLQLEP